MKNVSMILWTNITRETHAKKLKKKFFRVFIFIKNKEIFYRTCHENVCK